MKRLAIVSSHPIQYNAPWFRLLANEPGIVLKVFYTWEQAAAGSTMDKGFGRMITWDIPLLEGYEHVFVKNVSADPGVHHFKGIVNPGLISEIESWGADLLLVIGWSFHSHLRCLRHFHKKIPVLFRGDSTLLDEVPGVKMWLRRIFLTWVYRHVDHALYVGTNNKAYFRKHGMKEKQLLLAPHAIDNTRFAGVGNEYDEAAIVWRKELNIPDDALVLLFAGKLERKKNPFFLLDIAAKVNDERLWIIFVGNGEWETSLKEAANGLQRVVFIDFQNQQKMPVVYRLGDVFILPSVGPGETWGLAGNEAMASHSPVMMSGKCGGAVDLIIEGKNGMVFEQGDVEKCSLFISSLINDRKLVRQMGKMSANHVENFSFTKIIHPLIQLSAKN
ncbi:glycosyltransferase family 4 protein [Paraflavitalea pollutisoli]|uniref:glycosyltransferase family 4 protein n=1 Tax=Paraflavitalea pollutisoli TaxID=3034143 RepID=UPI0023EBD906|nr:glycosyltransferase family 4 protein [Paraflavitalea sp. H1-2-19X]